MTNHPADAPARSRRSLRSLLVAAVVIGATVAVDGATSTPSGAAASRPEIRHAVAKAMCRAKPRRQQCYVMRLVPATSHTRGAEAYRVGDGAAVSATGPAGGLSPGLLRSAYQIPTTGGTGQTIALIEAYDDPTIEADLGTFDEQYRLPACTIANGCLQVVNELGQTSPLPSSPPPGDDWTTETSLDVEVAHSVCTSCHLLVVEADSDGTSPDDLAIAANEAAALGATEISNSYGSAESDFDPPADVQADYDHPGVVVTAAVGDDGYDSFDQWLLYGSVPSSPSFPASSPDVVAVGGTTLDLDQAGHRSSETVWNSDGPNDQYEEIYGLYGATGGGCSTLFAAPTWQRSLSGWSNTECGTARLAADVSAVGDPFTGFDVYDSADGLGWFTEGGASLPTPLIAGLFALAGGANGVPYPAKTLYANAKDFFDVTTGGNGFCGGEGRSQCADWAALGFGTLDCDDASSTAKAGTLACDAAKGYDGPSGLGTPKGIAGFKPKG